ncbi:hypothetical protein RW092_20975 [Paenibacillus sp. 3LSP]|jgi:hypothetical protein|nr:MULTISPECIES: hypothetical protein [Paenibacillus]MDU0332647.1 hypothetical protein [Paenibacillus sp. 3LSP]
MREIEYKAHGNLLIPFVYVDMDSLMDNYDWFMIGVKQVRRKKKKRGA